MLPKLYAKMQYCISYAIHSHVVRVRSCTDRRKCEPPQCFRNRDDAKPQGQWLGAAAGGAAAAAPTAAAC